MCQPIGRQQKRLHIVIAVEAHHVCRFYQVTSLNDYYGGSFLLAWDRTPDKCNRYHRHKMDSGTIDVNIKTKQPLTETVTVIVYATYSSDIIIEDGRVYVQNF